MGYLCGVTDLAQPLTGLNTAEARLAAALARPRLIAFACIIGLTAAGWLALGWMAAQTPYAWQALCRPQAAGSWLALLVALPMWAAMVLAMMLPTAGPMILTYAEIADTAARKGEPVVSPLMLTAGYLAVWLGFAFPAALAQGALASAGLADGERAGPLLAGFIFIGAGLYQFSALKRACLTLCQRPFPFLFANWTTERLGVFRLGLRQGLYCVGCCWAMMALMFAVGAMNAVWMAMLGVAMIVEKLSSGARWSNAIGAVLLALGIGTVMMAMW
jgi:predicted metal-binding membrane protein